MKTTRNLGLILAALLFWLTPCWGGADKKNEVEDIGNRRVAHRSIISQEKESASASSTPPKSTTPRR